jgi:hypothetical protein
MHSYDLHVLRDVNRWSVQDVDEREHFSDLDYGRTVAWARAHAQRVAERGRAARVLIHVPGRAPDIEEFVPPSQG